MSMGFFASGAMGQGGGPPPAGIEVIGSTQATVAASISVAMPAVVDAGDWLYVVIATHGSVTVSTPSGWTAMGDAGAGANVLWTYTFRRLANGTEGGTSVSFGLSPSNRAVAICHRIPVAMVNNATAPSSSSATGTGQNPDPPSHSPAWGAEDTIWFAWAAVGARQITSLPYANNNLYVSIPEFGLATCSIQSNTATLDPPPFTAASTGAWVARTVAFRPA